MDNLKIYEAAREVPENAKKKIGGGRLKGMTDINPMWRIKKLTELFGPAGVGWYFEILDLWILDGSDGNKTANAKINLYVKDGDEWSKPIAGVGGGAFVSKESGGMYTNDECYKMALTDALSVSCKALGIGADVYWAADNTKYNDTKKPSFQKVEDELPFPESKVVCCECGKEVSPKMAKMCEEKYGYIACSENCKERHEIRKIKVNGGSEE